MSWTAREIGEASKAALERGTERAAGGEPRQPAPLLLFRPAARPFWTIASSDARMS